MPLIIRKSDSLLKHQLILAFPLLIFFELLFILQQEIVPFPDTQAWQAHFLKGVFVMAILEFFSHKLLPRHYSGRKVRMLALCLALGAAISFEILQEITPLTGNIVIDTFLGKSNFQWGDIFADFLGSIAYLSISTLVIRLERHATSGSSNEKLFK